MFGTRAYEGRKAASHAIFCCPIIQLCSVLLKLCVVTQALASLCVLVGDTHTAEPVRFTTLSCGLLQPKDTAFHVNAELTPSS